MRSIALHDRYFDVGSWDTDRIPPTSQTDLTPQPPSLQGKGEKSYSPLLVGEGLGERSNTI
jgi:hypothetical protein